MPARRPDTPPTDDAARDRSWWAVFKEYGHRFARTEIPTLAGALAFFSLLSLAPLAVMLLWISTLVYPQAQEAFLSQIGMLAGPQLEDTVRMVLANANQRSRAGGLSPVVGIVSLLFGATVVFGQLQVALNRIFGTDTGHIQGAMAWLRKRLLSFGAILTMGLGLVTAMLVESVFDLLPGLVAGVWPVVAGFVSFAIASTAFAAMYYWLPDRNVSKRRALEGGVLTALLFTIGRWVIGLYLGHARLGSDYGAAGGLAVMLAWLYYSAVVVLAGALATAMLDRFEQARGLRGRH